MKARFCIVAITVIASLTPQLAMAAGECEEDPDICSGPRSWFEDFNDGVPLVPSDDWQARNGNSPQPRYADGKAEFDGFEDGPWVVVDSADWLFEGKSTINIKMDPNPNIGFEDKGAGWWMNVDNEQTDGGYYAIYGVLERDVDGNQQYRFGNPQGFTNWEMELPEALIVPIPEGSGIDASIVITPGAVVGDPIPEPDMVTGEVIFPEDFTPSMAEVSYTITDDSATEHTGSFMIPPQFNPPEGRDQKWLTLFSFADGWGIIDEVEIINEGRTTSQTLACDLDGDGDCDGTDIDMLYEGGTTPAAIGTWLEQASSPDNPYKADQADVYVLGDVNLNGDVDSADLGLLLNNFGATDGPGFGGGDQNGDSNVDSADLGLLLNNFGASSVAVPEPASQSMLVLLVGGLLLIRRRSRAS